MDHFQKTVENRICLMELLSEQADSMITDDCKGEIIVRKKDGKSVYYKRFRGKEQDGSDLLIELGTDMDPATLSVLQSRFYAKQKKALDHDRKLLSTLIQSSYMPFDPDTILASLPKTWRGPLEKSLSFTSNQATKDWAKAPYKRNQFPYDQRTYLLPSGIEVHSHAEYLIGCALEARGIPFRYDMEIELVAPGDKIVTRCPDFSFMTLLMKVIHWEHLGMLDQLNYIASTSNKLTLYMENGILPGINLILTADPPGRHITLEEIEMVIDRQLIPMLQN